MVRCLFKRKSVGLCAMILFISCQTLAASPVVRTDAGLIQGVADDNILVYKGIPFARPPIGNLRWRPPQPPKHWNGLLKADHFPSQCSQLGPPLPTMPEEPTSEDCLYLNVWAPRELRKVKRPVMVFFYGPVTASALERALIAAGAPAPS